VVGLGMNVHSGPPGAAVLDRAAGRRIGRPALLESWLRRLDQRLGQWEGVASAYRERCATVGRRVWVGLPGERIEGEAESIDLQGRLVVRMDDGSRRAVAAGDVTHVRPGGTSW
jgi:BirA family biotin operon repressor/biotin-[acetyl-CoA-carboxylase] ligase